MDLLVASRRIVIDVLFTVRPRTLKQAPGDGWVVDTGELVQDFVLERPKWHRAKTEEPKIPVCPEGIEVQVQTLLKKWLQWLQFVGIVSEGNKFSFQTELKSL
jgi:hypothetical protein